MNLVILKGNICNDLEIIGDTVGTPYTRFTVAVRRNSETSDFIDCVAFCQSASFLCNNFKKGSPILIRGELHVDTYTTAEGERKRSVSVVCGNIEFAGGVRDADN